MTTTLLRGEAAINEGLKRRGPGLRARLANESWLGRVIEAGEIYARARTGSLRAQADLFEAMSRDDFPLLFGDFIGYTLAQRYAEAPSVWQRFATRTTVPDFRPSKVLDVLGGRALLDDVPEHGPFPRRKMTESDFELTVGKKGATIMWSWEANVDDRLGVFDRVPGDFAVAARRTEDYTATSVIATATGPAAWLGTPGTGKLTRDNLESAIAGIMTKKDSDGAPIVVDTPVLVVPPSLGLTAANIVNTTEIRTTDGSKQSTVNGNGLSATPDVVVNPWLGVVDKSANVATTWYLLPSPNTPRPAVYASFLRGYEEPDVRVRNDQGSRPGGGSIDPAEGSFDADDIEYRVRHVVGAGHGFAEAVYASTGTA